MGWKIGEIVKRTSLTARALHFYEEQGIIGPIFRNASGHRVYNQSDLLRLQQIKTLRQLGVSISDMPKVLNDTDQLTPLLKQQLSRLQQQREAIQQLENKIGMLVETLETQTQSPFDLDEILFQTLESMAMYEKYFKKTEIDAMHQQPHSPENGENFEDAWNHWIAKMQSALSSGESPKSKTVQTLMNHWVEMTKHLTNNDDAKLKAFNELLHNEPQARKDHGINDELFEFMAKASNAH
ncbi:hypothetical protein CYQ88_09230 [Hydrogenovibrio sp. SC-1]|uniref:MerR family transcriptional regulator n=1 Tax=Hydrogenovibrio sp. SC-1 TaxID=2065820 RepID=UPI000C7D2309|nr:MerR family transcriptional regulator [Hydrogenovibrio sp. SC-1]PLA73793.1 hypothetical protein CYQ88_09230 [Hydrogenovibrio sp. SC-1]